MLDNTLTLPVDAANDGNPADQVFSRFEELTGKSVYNGPDHDLSGLRDQLTLLRTLPKQSGNFRGMARSAAKFTRDYEVAGVDSTTTIVSPGIIEVSTSFPRGVSAAERIEARQRVISLLDMDNFIDRLQGQCEY